VSENIKAWQCIGCGKLESPQTCIGVCQDRKVELVYASEHMSMLTHLAAMTSERDRAVALLRRLASVTPHDGMWEQTVRSFQRETRRCVSQLQEGGRPRRGGQEP